MTINNQSASWGQLLSGRNGLRSLALAGGVAVYAINIHIVTTILPSVVQDIGGLNWYAWNTTLFVAASIIGSALSASLITSIGLRGAYLLGMAVFMLGSLAAAFSPTMLFMLGARTLQGFGGGLILGLSYSSVRIVFAKQLWPRAMALVSSMWGIATLAGPAIGGIFAENGHWRWAFLSIIPLALFITLLIATQLTAHQGNSTKISNQTPLFKITLLAFSVLVIAFGGLANSVFVTALAFVVVGFILYGIKRHDMRSSTPLFPYGTYSLRQPLGSLYAGIVLMSVGITSEIFVPYFLQIIHHVRPLSAGYITALMSAGWTTGAILMASRSPIFANKLFFIGPITSGLSLLVLGVLLPLQTLNTELNAMWVIYVCLFGVGFGIGMLWPHLVTRVFVSARPGQENLASATVTTLQLYGLAIGAAVAGMITSAAGIDSGSLEGAQRAALFLLLSFSALPIFFIFISKAARQIVKNQ